MIVVASCTQSSDGITSLSTPTQQAIDVSPTLVVTNTLISSPPSTIVPTLSVQDARTHLLELLASNGDCRLPCLFGITPGTSTYQESQAILTPLLSLSGSTAFIPEGGVVSPNYIEEDLLLATIIGFNIDTLSDNQIVNRVGFHARQMKKTVSTENGPGFEPIFDYSVFGERMNYYMLYSILTTYGHPEIVMIGTVAHIPPREPAGGFHILLLYPEQGIMIEYTTQMYTSGSYVSGCPANAHVQIDLYPPGNAEAFFAFLEKKGADWTVKKNWYKPLEETTSMSIDEFYETFRVPNDKCIETLANLWPIPDP